MLACSHIPPAPPSSVPESALYWLPAYTELLSSALRVPAARADETAFLEDEQAAAVGALPGKVLSPVVLLFWLTFVAGSMFFQHAGDGIGAGENGLPPLPGDRWAADTAELFHY